MRIGWRALALGWFVVFAGVVACDSSCDGGGRTFAEGDVWTCSDGCNSCSCNEGQVTSTLIGCPSPPGPAANKLSCWDQNYWQPHGTSWACSDCDVCSCSDGAVVRTPRECGEGGSVD